MCLPLHHLVFLVLRIMKRMLFYFVGSRYLMITSEMWQRYIVSCGVCCIQYCTNLLQWNLFHVDCRWREDSIYPAVGWCLSLPHAVLQTGTEVTSTAYAQWLFVLVRPRLQRNLCRPGEIQVTICMFCWVLWEFEVVPYVKMVTHASCHYRDRHSMFKELYTEWEFMS